MLTTTGAMITVVGGGGSATASGVRRPIVAAVLQVASRLGGSSLFARDDDKGEAEKG